MENRQWPQWVLDVQRWFFQSSYDKLDQLLGRNGPEDRWETQGGFSPSPLCAKITGIDQNKYRKLRQVFLKISTL